MHKIQFVLYKQSFEKKYLSLLGVTEQRNYTPVLDYLLIGSDEVFNCIQKNANVGYSLELFGKDNCARKLMSYAASFGNTTFDKLNQYGKTKEIGQLLKRFDVISVRDSNSGSIVQKLTGIVPEYHLDPVLAYDYIRKCNHIPDIHSQVRYLILYAYSGRISNKEADWIAAYAKKKKLKIYTIGGVQKCADRFIDCSPLEVIAYFKNAKAVITDTFHGSIFSIITHRRFVTLVRKSAGNVYGNEEKLTDLLGRVGLRERMIESIDSANMILETDINYQKVDDLIYSERLRTERYFQENILF